MNEKLYKLIREYRKSFVKHWEDELYKWQVVQCFQRHWDIQAKDFGQMLKLSTEKTGNLLASKSEYPRAIIISMADESEEAVHDMFAKLYDESISLRERIKAFKHSADELQDKHNALHPEKVWKNHFQTENAISTYLWLRYPDKYYIYKYGVFNDVAEALGYNGLIRHGAGVDNLINGFRMYDEIRTALQHDEELPTMLKNRLGEDSYADLQLNTLTIDFGYHINKYMRYYCVGFHIGDEGSQLDRFFKEELWEGYFHITNDRAQLNRAKDIRKGETLILKTSFTKGKNHNIPCLRIHAIAEITESPYISTPGENGYVLVSCKVRFLDKNVREFEGAPFGKFRRTIDICKNETLIDYAAEIKRRSTEPHMKHQRFIDLLKANRNLIISGAPGTGKTYLAKAIANEMGAETGFVQFHPSYDYTDFVEGLRPTQPDENGNIGFRRQDGVFKTFCKQALKNFEDSQKTVEVLEREKGAQDVLQSFIDEAIEKGETFPMKTKSGNKFFITADSEDYISILIPYNPIVKEIAVAKKDILPLLENNTKIERVKDVREFFGRPTNTQQDSYTFAIYQILKTRNRTKKDVSIVPLKPFVFIIDEINRGELNKIFGELFFAIELDYRGRTGCVYTQYQNLVDESDVFKKGFFVPENVYIIGTMNDIDRSVESMDFAMRRRFAWVEVNPEDNAEEILMASSAISNADRQELLSRMELLNKAIRSIPTLGNSYQLGGAYFKSFENCSGNFDMLWEMHIQSLLSEYLRGSRNKDEEMKLLRDTFFHVSTEDELAD